MGESGDVWENQGDDGGVWLDRRRRDSPQLRHPATAGGSFVRTRLSNQLIGCFGLLVAVLGSLCVRAWLVLSFVRVFTRAFVYYLFVLAQLTDALFLVTAPSRWRCLFKDGRGGGA